MNHVRKTLAETCPDVEWDLDYEVPTNFFVVQARRCGKAVSCHIPAFIIHTPSLSFATLRTVAVELSTRLSDDALNLVAACLKQTYFM